MISFDVLQVTPPHLNKYPYYLISADWESGYSMGFLLQHKLKSLVTAIMVIKLYKQFFDIDPQVSCLDTGELGTFAAFQTYLLSEPDLLS
ncbi:hypothetical protein HDU80_003387, partial [Chytriomyces hyalinus]